MAYATIHPTGRMQVFLSKPAYRDRLNSVGLQASFEAAKSTRWNEGPRLDHLVLRWFPATFAVGSVGCDTHHGLIRQKQHTPEVNLSKDKPTSKRKRNG